MTLAFPYESLCIECHILFSWRIENKKKKQNNLLTAKFATEYGQLQEILFRILNAEFKSIYIYL